MSVLVTRPGLQGIKLTEMLNKIGIAALHFPLFNIEASKDLNLLPFKFTQLKTNDYVVAVSKNAVHYAHQTLKSLGLSWRSDLHYFAIGQSTAEYLTSLSELCVFYPFKQQNSEGLLNLQAMKQERLVNKQILLLRGNEGRQLFPEQIVIRNAQIDIIECYQRLPLLYDNIMEQVSLWKRAGISYILATSVEILDHLINIVPTSEHIWLKHCTLITVSDRIAQLAQLYGWRDILISERPDNITLLSTVASRFT